MFENEQEVVVKEESHTALILVLILIGVPFVPGLLIGWLLFQLVFMKLKQKPSILFSILSVTALILYISYLLIQPFNHIALNKESLTTPYIFISLSVAWVVFLWSSFYFPRKLKKRPELREMTSSWAKDFVYRKTPYEILLKKYFIKNLQEGKYYSSIGAPMGVLEEKTLISEDGQGNLEYFDKPAIVDARYTERNKHTLATGATGSGKTITLLNEIRNDFEVGNTVCVVDFKKSQEWIYFLSKWAKEYNRPFYHFTSGKLGTYNNPYADYQASYDPLAKGSIQSKADMVLNMRAWDGAAEVYKKQTQTLLVSIFYLLENVNKEDTKNIIPWDKGGLSQFVAALKVENLILLIAQLEKDFTYKEAAGITLTESDKDKLNQLKSLYETLTTRGGALKDQIDNLVANCRTMIMSDYGDWLAKGQTPNHIDLIELATTTDENKPVILFSFNPLEESEFAKIMGSLIASDLSRTASYKNETKITTPFGLYVDEFQILPPSSVTDMLEKSRSSGFYITLSLQSLEQITVSANGMMAVTNGMIDTVQNFIIHAGASQDSATTLSKIIGDMKVKRYKVMTERHGGLLAIFKPSNWFGQSDGKVTNSLEDEWIVSPSKFQSLKAPTKENGYKATAYYITKACDDPGFKKANRTVARLVHVISEKEIARGVPDSFTLQFNSPRKELLLWKKENIEVNKENLSAQLTILPEPQKLVQSIYEEFPDEEQFQEVPTEVIHTEVKDSLLDEIQVSSQTEELDLLAGLGTLGNKTTTKTTSFQRLKNK